MHRSASEGRGFALLALAALVAVWPTPGRADAPAKTFPPLPLSVQVAGLPAWLRANTDIPPEALVSLVKGVATILVDRGGPDNAGRRIVVVRREALSDFATGVIDGHSELVRLDIDCKASQFRLISRDIHPGNGLTGPGRLVAPDTAMAGVPPNTDLAFLAKAACDPSYQPPLARYLTAASAAPAPPPQPGQPAATAPPAPPPTPPPAPVVRAPTVVAQAQAPAAPAQAVSAPPPPPPPPPPARPRTVAAQAQVQTPPSPDARPQRQTGRYVAQVSAAGSEALARKLLADVSRRVPEAAGLPTSVDRVHVNDGTLYRASIVGFPTSEAAEAFCVKLRAARLPCWVR
jgi:hypothetical protein